MMVCTRRARQMLMLPLMFAGVIGWLFLPGVPLKRASAKGRSAAAKPSTQKAASGLDSERQAALVKLYSQARTGAPTSEEEADILRRFAAGFAVSELEADVVISRALYDYYLSGSELTKEQEVLLARYKSFVAQRGTDIRDLKSRVLSEHRIRAAAEGSVAPTAPPANDTCAGAEVIPGAGPFPYVTAVTDTAMATSTGDPAIPSCTTPASPPPTVVSRTVWYTFTPGVTAQYTISSCSNAPTATTVEDTVMGIYTSTSGCAGVFTEWPSGVFTDGCDDDGCAVGALQSVITTRLDSGTQYFIVMSEYGNSPPVVGLTNVQLRVNQVLPAANDTCAGASALLLNTPINGATVAGSIPIANNDYVLSGSACFTGIGQTSSTAGGDDVVYSFTAPSAGDYSFRVFNYSSPDIADLVVYVASSCPAATPGSPVTVTTCLAASNRSSVSTAEEVMCLPLSASQQVFIFVDEVAQSLGSTFTIEVTRCTRETEPNDTPATANTLSLGIEGTSSPASDADFYALGASPAGSRLFALVDGVAANSSDFDLRVTTTTDTLEYDDRNNDIPFGNLSANVAGTPLTGVATFLRVNINPALASEPYRVYSVVQPPIAQATNEVEPNDTIGQASTGANLYFKGALAGPAPSTDVDIFSFNAAAGDLVHIGLDGDPLRDNTPLDAKLGLLDGAGSVLVEVDDANSVSDTTPSPGTLTGVKPFSPAEGLVYRVTTTGTYYARVKVSTIAPNATAAGDYLLSVSKNGSTGGGGSNSISGTISYCIDQTKKVPNATVQTTSGTPSATTNTNASGFYQLTGLGAGPYTIAPSKTGAVSGITAFDAALVAQYVAGITTPNSCQMLAGDSSNNGSLSAFDAALIAQTVASISNPGIAGTWKVVPSSRSYSMLNGNLTNENYDAVLVGDVSGNWTPAGPEGSIAPAGGGNVAVSLPSQSAPAGSNNVMVPVIVGNTTGQGIIAYDFTYTFDPSVIQLANPAFETSGTLSSGWTITPNTSTPGQIRIVAFNTTPLSGQGTLIFIKFNVVGSQGSTTLLTWTNFMFNEGSPTATLGDGKFTVSAPTAVQLEKFSASSYEKGVFIEWKTGFETSNLGFNIYRQQAGQLEPVTKEMLAGSALLTGPTPLVAGRSYGWWDNQVSDSRNALYYLEDVDVNGSRTMHGPIVAGQVGGKPPAISQAELLSRMGRGVPHIRLYVPDQAGSGKGGGSVGQPQKQGELASGSAVKLWVRETGWYRVSQPSLLAAGLDSSVDPRRLQMYVDGQEVAIDVIGAEDGRLDASDAIEFYATAVDSPFTNKRVYWLVAGAQPGKRITRIASQAKAVAGGSYTYVVERKDKTIYFSALRNGEAENFFGPVVASQAVDQSVTLQHVDQSAGTLPMLEVGVQGVTAAMHQVRVTLNGAYVGDVVYGGQIAGRATITLTQGQLVEGENQITLMSVGGASDVSLADYVRISYQHRYRPEGEKLSFTATGNQVVSVYGFSNSQIRVIDVTDAASPREIEGAIEQAGGEYGMNMRLPSGGERRLIAFTEGQAAEPVAVAPNKPSKWRQTGNGADLIMITTGELASSLDPLRVLRQSQLLAVTVVDVEDIYDEFNYGQKSPYAIREFLAYAKGSWKRKPVYVLIGGDGSFDPKNYLGGGETDVLPSKLLDTAFMETASDDWFADFNGDGLAEMAVGRLPCRTPGEAQTMVAKIISYEKAGSARSVLLVSDANDGYDFEGANAQLKPMLPTNTRIEEIKRGSLDPGVARTMLIDAINRGQSIVNYAGHGSVTLWRGDLLTSADAELFTNERSLALFLTMTCLNGYFEDPVVDGLAESLMKAEHGGAVAVWASTGMCEPRVQALINKEMCRLLFTQDTVTKRFPTLGEAAVKAKLAITDPDVRRTYMLFGDPSMRLR
jgi:hypothetical protein